MRPTSEDLGIGATDPFGNPLSFARQTVSASIIDKFTFSPLTFSSNPGPIVPNERVAVDGAFKVPTLRNVDLTGPYFHNGGQATLMQVVHCYNRGGDRRDVNCGFGDTSGYAGVCTNLDPDITLLGLSELQLQELVDFLTTLTDDRVRYEKAPFDHPQIFIPNGHPGDQFAVVPDPASGGSHAKDSLLELPAVGAGGRTTPIPTFLGLDPKLN